MTIRASTCAPQRVKDFLAGTLGDYELRVFEQHLDTCASAERNLIIKPLHPQSGTNCRVLSAAVTNRLVMSLESHCAVNWRLIASCWGRVMIREWSDGSGLTKSSGCWGEAAWASCSKDLIPR